jgi:transcriptional regulator with XRE-family HTH domain
MPVAISPTSGFAPVADRSKKMHSTTIIACFGASVRKLRFSRGFTQEELAERADLHRSYLADLERGTRNPTLRTIKKLAGGLGISMSDLLSEAERNCF